MADAPLLAARNLVFAWPENPQKRILDNLDCELAAGESVGLCGRNGSGKTTLLRCFTGLARPKAGTITLEGRIMRGEKDFQSLRRVVGLVLQDADDQILFPSVLEDLAFGPLNLGLSQREAQERAREALELVGMDKFADRLTSKLSGGEKKLIAMAGILAMRPRVLLLDEPTNDLDEEACRRIENLIRALPCAKMVISHDLKFLFRACSRVLRLENGRLRELAGANEDRRN